MAKFGPAGFEIENFSEDFMYDDDDEDEFDDPFVRKSSLTSQQNKPSSGGGLTNGWPACEATRERNDVVVTPAALPLDDYRRAVVNGNLAAIEQYLAQGVRVDHQLASGWTGLMHAANSGCPEVVGMLIQHGADPNHACDMYTVLMAACCSKCQSEDAVLECVRQLVECKADVNAYDRYHSSPTIYASREGRSRVVSLLLKNGADINKQDNRGNTALMGACLRGHVHVVRVLLEHGADVYKRSLDGSTAAEIATMHGHAKIEDMLERVIGSNQPKLVLTEEDIKELDAQAEKDGPQSLLGKGQENGVTKYGELEMLLAGLELGHLIPLFHEHQVPFEDVLRMTDNDLVKMGVTRMGHRKKILDSIHQIHKKEWLPNSLSTVQYTKKITSVESGNMLQNLKKHLSYIGSTVGYVGDQLREDGSILLNAQEGSGATELASHTEEAMTNVRNLYQELTRLRTHLSKYVGDDQYQPADLIRPPRRKRKGKKKLRALVSSVLVVGVIGVLVWKSDSIVEAVWKT